MKKVEIQIEAWGHQSFSRSIIPRARKILKEKYNYGLALREGIDHSKTKKISDEGSGKYIYTVVWNIYKFNEL